MYKEWHIIVHGCYTVHYNKCGKNYCIHMHEKTIYLGGSTFNTCKETILVKVLNVFISTI